MVKDVDMQTLTRGLMCLMVLGLSACVQSVGADDDGKEVAVVIEPERDDEGNLVRVEKTEAQWEAELSEQEFRILRHKGTERAGTGRYLENKADGVYACAGCGLVLFDARTKFDSGTGWPSFYRPIAEGFVGEIEDTSHGMRRVENVCARCGGHLGHVFPDGPQPTGLRYCINGYSLDFVEREKFDQLKAEAKDDGS